MIKKIGVLAVLFLVIGMGSAWAIEAVHDWADGQANSDVYYVKAGGMFVRGLDGILESPVELACHTYKGATEELGYGEGILKGLGMGTLWMLDGGVRGAWDIITALLPDYHGEPVQHELECWGGGGGGETTA